MELSKTPYEEYLRQSITDEKARLDSLSDEFAKSNPIKKQILKRHIEEAVQNIELLSADLEKYGHGLWWLANLARKEMKKQSTSLNWKRSNAATTGSKECRPRSGETHSYEADDWKTSRSHKHSSNESTDSSKTLVGAPIGRPKIGSPVGTPIPSSKYNSAGTRLKHSTCRKTSNWHSGESADYWNTNRHAKENRRQSGN